MTDDGRALSKSKGQGFAARSWLENDGDAAEQWQASKRGPSPVQNGVWEMALGAGALRHLTGKTGLAAFETCEAGDLVILSSRADIDAPCRFYDSITLRKTGSLAIYPAQGFGGFRIVTARDVTGDRLWNTPNRRTHRARWINRSE